jgi:hypothetical protein
MAKVPDDRRTRLHAATYIWNHVTSTRRTYLKNSFVAFGNRTGFGRADTRTCALGHTWKYVVRLAPAGCLDEFRDRPVETLRFGVEETVTALLEDDEPGPGDVLRGVEASRQGCPSPKVYCPGFVQLESKNYRNVEVLKGPGRLSGSKSGCSIRH